ncbi:MAG TPA: Holliday junction branch migration protein RuvA [Planctomycetota bacterium]|nr:Holliday junction branch migration protein RuvA [Planctomycetota bacterium]
MFDYLEGRLERSEATAIVVEVAGLGYALQTPLGTAARLGRPGATVRCYICTVRHDELPRLLGFASKEERDLCTLLLKVAGIGPSLALALLSADTPRRLLEAIQNDDVLWLKRVKGVGAKTAERICLEVRDRAATWLSAFTHDPTTKAATRDPRRVDAEQALVALGFSDKEAEARVSKVLERDADADVEALVKAALRG